MTKFIGIKNNNICIVSDTEFNSNNLEIIKLSKEMYNLSFEELVLNYRFKNGQLVNI